MALLPAASVCMPGVSGHMSPGAEAGAGAPKPPSTGAPPGSGRAKNCANRELCVSKRRITVTAGRGVAAAAILAENRRRCEIAFLNAKRRAVRELYQPKPSDIFYCV